MFFEDVEKYLSVHHRKKRWLKLFTFLAAIVVFCTTYALILPAITMEKSGCEIPEHVHTEACYTQVSTVSKTRLVCPLEVHEHTQDCYDESGSPVCGYAGLVVHQHDSSCYDEEGNLWCQLPELGTHTHTESCYAVPETADAPVHVHTEDCYTRQRGELICTQAVTEGHTHSEDCYSETRELVCQTPESDGHQHTEACFEPIAAPAAGDEETSAENSSLVCSLEESSGHKHDENCYTTSMALTCGLEKAPGHQHTDECYAWEDVLTCQLSTEPAEEPEPAAPVLVCGSQEIILHTHTAACLDGSGKPVCGKPQVLAHQHSADCFQTVEEPADTETLTCTNTDEDHSHTALCYGSWELSCGLEEHVHTMECSADPTADVETAQEWEQSFAEVRLTGEWPVDVLAIAKTQLGYAESEKNYVVGEDGVCRGYSRYGDWFGCPYGDWCAMFASFCIHYAEVEGMPLDMSCPSWIEELRALELYRPARSEDPQQQYTPSAGDLVFYDWEQDGIADHVGLVAEVTPATEAEAAKLITLEGNVEDRVQYMGYALDNPVILGFGQLLEQSFFCGKTGHAHTADCGGEGVCPLEEHIHTDACFTENAVVSDQERLAELIALIDALPTSEEVEEKLAALEEAEDEEGYAAYFEEVRKQCVPVYIFYEALDPQLQELVTNRDKLFALEWLWSAMTYALTDTLNVTAVNSHNYSATIIYHSSSGMSVGNNTSGEKDYKYWTAVVVELENGRYVVKQIVAANGTSKSSLYASGNGFILLFHTNNVSASLNANVGDTVTMSSDFWKTNHSYTGTVYGTVTFTSFSAQPKPDKDNSGKLTIVPGADTREMIEVNLYDYGTNINDLYNGDHNYPGFQQEYGSTNVGDSFSQWSSFNFGNNITADLAAGHSGVTNAGGDINRTENGANSPISGAMQTTLGADGYPALADGTSLGYLFSSSTYAAKKNSQSINGLFQYNERTGAYSFNSRENHAQFNAGSDTFTLYQQIISSNFMMYPFGNFLPFNDIVHLSAQASTIDKAYLEAIASSAQYKYNNGAVEAYGTLSTQLRKFIGLMDKAYPGGWTAVDCMNEYFRAARIPGRFTNGEPNVNGVPLVQKLYSIDYDEPTDFYFGMEMKMNFMQPKGGLTGIDGQQPMVFYFTGDDDVWVYVDGVLFLDLSGIHRHVGGEIDFVNGLVKYYTLDVSTGDVGTTPYKTVPFSDLVSTGLNSKGTFADYSKHSFNFYYMERGAGSGVCRMNFNFPLLRKNTISVTKELSVDEQDKLPLLGNPDFRFQILRENGAELFIAEGTPYDILDTAGNKIGDGTVGTDGVFTLKANQTAVFSNIAENAGRYFVRELLKPKDFAQYGTIQVNGTSQTTNYDVTVNNESFKGVDSPVQDVSDGSTSFHFNNQVTFNKLGSLSIGKTLTSYSPARSIPQFDFEVTLDGAPLPVGTVYTVGTESHTVTLAGIISLAPDETAVITNILSGSRFTVRETAASSADYVVTYFVNDAEPVQAEDGVSGVIQTNTETRISVNNAEQGATVTIPIQKTLQAPDGEEHSYRFCLEQVTDQGGVTPVEPAFTRELTIPVCLDPANGAFEIGYPKAGLGDLPQTFYYKITETPDRVGEPDTSFDPAVYIVQVTVTDNGGTLSASVTKVWKDSEELTASDGQVLAVAFTNTIVRYELPETGGAGTTLHTTGGLALIFCAAILLYIHTKRRKEDSPSS